MRPSYSDCRRYSDLSNLKIDYYCPYFYDDAGDEEYGGWVIDFLGAGALGEVTGIGEYEDSST